jgi:hypothetical protein
MISILDTAHRQQTKQDQCRFLHFVLLSRPEIGQQGQMTVSAIS